MEKNLDNNTILDAGLNSAGDQQAERASKLKRFLGVLIDVSICFIISGILKFVYYNYVLEPVTDQGEKRHWGTSDPLWMSIFDAALILFFPMVFELVWRRSVGKFIVGAKVLDINGGEATQKQIINRNLDRVIPFDAFSYLFSNGWHDYFAKTKVVEVKRK